MPLTLPIASFDPENYTRAEPGVEGLIDLVKWELWKWDGGETPSRLTLPKSSEALSDLEYLPPSHPIIPLLLPARMALLENLSMFSEEILEQVLSLTPDPSANLSIGPSEIIPELRAATLRSDVLPVVCGSAFKHIGTELLMNYIGELFPSPVDLAGGVPTPKEPLRMLAWKVGWDKRKGWMTFVRVYSGTLNRQSAVYNATRNQREKVSKILLLYASEAEEVDSLSFGSVGVVLGLRFTRTGDTLVSTHRASETSSLQDIVPPPAVMSLSVLPQSQADLRPVQEALESLARTDPSVRIETQEGQILIHGLGSLHLEIVESRLREEWNAHFEIGSRRVSYREGLAPSAPAITNGQWRSDLAGKHIQVSVELSIRSLEEDEQGDPLWDDNIVTDGTGHPLRPPDTVSNQTDPMSNVARGIFNTLSNSPNTSLPLSHLHITVDGFNYPSDVPSSVLAGASAFILRDYIKTAGMGPLMEPYVRLKINVSEETLGKVVKDLTEHGGEVLDLATSGGLEGVEDIEPYSTDGVYIPPDELSPSASNVTGRETTSRVRRSVYAVAPLSRMLDYSNRLRALSGGHGIFEMVNAGFREVTESRKMEILREIGRA